MIIGLTGTLGSGKDAVADYLKKKGFGCFVLSDILKEEAKKRNLEPTRENLQDVGNELRAEHGPGVLAKMVVDAIKAYGHNNVVVDGIRNSGEIDELSKLSDFFLVAVDAPEETRFERMKSRGRKDDPKTLGQFRKMDARDRGVNEPSTGQQVGECIKQARFVIVNDSTVEKLFEKVERLLADLMKKAR